MVVCSLFLSLVEIFFGIGDLEHPIEVRISSKNMRIKGSRISWSDLPDDLLSTISTKLLLGDFLNFQIVCTTWRAVATQLSQCQDSPLLMLPWPQVDNNIGYFLCPVDGRWYRLNQPEFDKRYKCVGSSHGWLLMMDVFSRDEIFLYNPFRGTRIDLPQWNGSYKSDDIIKVALSSTPTGPNCTIIILDLTFNGFRFCSIGDAKWMVEESNSYFQIDAVVFRGRFYLLSYHKPKSTTNAAAHLKCEYLGFPHMSFPYEYVSHLVESRGEILLVLRRNRSIGMPANSFVVFKLDLSTSSWVRMREIGNQVLFLGKSCCVSFTATELGCRENQIYFTEPDCDNTRWWVFDMEDGSIKSGLTSYDPFLFGSCIFGGEPSWITPSFV